MRPRWPTSPSPAPSGRESRGSHPQDERAATRAKVAAIVAGAVMSGQALSITLDRATTTWLARRGVTRPRLVMAAVAAAAAGLSQYRGAGDAG